MTSQQIRHLAGLLRTIPLEAVLRLSGAQPDRVDKRKWHTAQGVVSVTGVKFMNWSRGQGGGGAIDLVMHLHTLGFQQAVHWLSQSFPGSFWPPSEPDRVFPKAFLALPAPDPAQLWRVRQYLTRERALAPALIEPLIQSGTLYADHRANAVFLLLGKENQSVGAELRGTSAQAWHGLAPGSQKDLGYFAVPASPRPGSRPALILVESAIDALSCFALHSQFRCISTAGARPDPRWLAGLLDQGHQVSCGFDADPTGDALALAMIARYPAIQRLRPSQHDWNDVLKARSWGLESPASRNSLKTKSSSLFETKH